MHFVKQSVVLQLLLHEAYARSHESEHVSAIIVPNCAMSRVPIKAPAAMMIRMSSLLLSLSSSIMKLLTPVLTREETREPVDSIDTDTIRGLRDRGAPPRLATERIPERALVIDGESGLDLRQRRH